MIGRMIANPMSARRNQAHDVRTLKNKVSNHKESGLHVMLGQNSKKGQCPRIVRPIIEGQCDFHCDPFAYSLKTSYTSFLIAAVSRFQQALKPASIVSSGFTDSW